MTTPSDSSWSDVGPGLGGVAAEALCAYELWRSASQEMDVRWVSGYGHDIDVTTPDGRTVRIDAKRAWRRGSPDGFLDCAPLKVSQTRPLDAFALVVLDDDDFSVSYDSAEPGHVSLRLEARGKDIYYLPADALQSLVDAGDARRVSDGKWRVRLESVTHLTSIGAMLDGRSDNGSLGE